MIQICMGYFGHFGLFCLSYGKVLDFALHGCIILHIDKWTKLNASLDIDIEPHKIPSTSIFFPFFGLNLMYVCLHALIISNISLNLKQYGPHTTSPQIKGTSKQGPIGGTFSDNWITIKLF